MVHWNAEDLKQWIQGLGKSRDTDFSPELLAALEDEIDQGHEDFYARIKGKSLE